MVDRLLRAELAEFIGRHLAADENRARQATNGPWQITRHYAPDAWIEITDRRGRFVTGIPGDPGVERGQAAADAAYLLARDPVAELARIRAHRLILKTLQSPGPDASIESVFGLGEIAAELLLAVAQQYEGRPGWRPEWRRDYGP